MTALNRLAFIGNSLPRRCGIATFTNDLQRAVAAARPDLHTGIVAMTDRGSAYDYPPVVQLQVRDDEPEDSVQAADFLNREGYEAVSLQHEFGIFGGEAGEHVVNLLSRLEMPVVTTLHTVLAEPAPAQRCVMERIVGASAKLIVMAEKGRDLLNGVYQVPLEKIEVVPHGIPDVPFAEPDRAKAELGFGGRSVILTFGLLSPNKGIEVMIDAMPLILRRRPDAVYVVLGATHPSLLRVQGEAYRESLSARASALGVEAHVVFLDQFVDLPTLLNFISMCDVYVTPYLNEAQLTSGTLAYSFGLGKAVVSTPYWHAQELLAQGRGVLVPFGDAVAIGSEIARLLTDDACRQAMRIRAYASSRSMKWENTAERYLAIFDNAWRRHRLQVVRPTEQAVPVPTARVQAIRPTPQMQTAHFESMCDDTGLFQHAIHSIPNRLHGYCVDDNARALLLACALNTPGEALLPEVLPSCFAAFLQHAWNPDARRFRNFMSFDRNWLDDAGSEDSHGRALWALGECAGSDPSASRRRWAAALFVEAAPAVESFHSPRAWAFALLGLDAYCATEAADDSIGRLRAQLAERLMVLLAAVETPGWVWFEEGLAYDNARLPQALISTGRAIGAPAFVAAGLRSLHWLMAQQTAPADHFRPIGTEGFADLRRPPRAFDQQPLEATASIAACCAAWHADGDPAWKAEAARAFAWFLGDNDLALPLVDLVSGSCRDGLHRDRVNENRGGESAVSYLLGLADIRLLARQNEARVTLAQSLA